jgi:competence protein ComEC
VGCSIIESVDNQRPRLFCWVPVWLGCGIGLYFTCPVEPGLVVYLGAGLAGVVCLLLALRWQSLWRAFLWIPFLVALGFGVAGGRGHWVQAPKLERPFYGAIEGTIAHLDRSASDKLRLTLIHPVLEEFAPQDTPARIRVSLHGQGATALVPGARVMLTGHLSPPAGAVEPGGFDFQRKAWFQRLGGLGYSRLPVMLAKPPEALNWSLRIFALRMQISRAIRAAIAGQPGAFGAAIVTGDRSALDPVLLQNLRRSNLAHLLAISGLHMGLLTGFVFALVRYSLALVPCLALRLPLKKIAAVVALLAGGGYLLMSGANVATQRAFVMVMVMLFAVLVDRPAVTLRAVALAAILILLLRPESLVEPGFQMSFAATSALVASFEFLKRLPQWVRLRQNRFGAFMAPVLALVVSSAVAGLATAPISAFHFNQVAQYGLLANLASVPVMGFVVMPAAVLAGVLYFVGLSGVAFWVMGKGIGWILMVAGTVAQLQGAVVRVPSAPVAVLAGVAFGGVVLILWHGRGRLLGAVLMVLAFVFWAQLQRPQVLITDNGRLVGIRQDGLRQLNRARGNGFAARVWLENDGDAGDQKMAAKRAVFGGDRDDWVLPLGSRKIAYVWSKKTPLSTLSARCGRVDVLIAPNSKPGVTGGCVLIAKASLKRSGAVSMRLLQGAISIKNARTEAGIRLWNNSPP